MSRLLNKDVFALDPTTSTLVNDGVTRVRTLPDRSTDEAAAVLRFEVDSFVCEGEYERGLDRILQVYLANIDKPVQPSVWVSGFFGSGKSHFVRVLEALWRDYTFYDGVKARDRGNLPQSIREALRELSAAAQREGGLWAASGMINEQQGQTLALSFLQIVFRAAGLPEQCGPATFLLWLRENGYEDRVRASLEAEGRTLEHELRNYLVSPWLAKALLAANPDLAETPAAVLQVIGKQFPNTASITTNDMLETLRDVLRSVAPIQNGRLPLTLIVLDELQQYIGEDSARSLAVQQLVEAVSGQMGGNVLLVATGQAALSGTPNLEKLQGRFTSRVMLSDKDVEQVVRQVVLRKSDDQKPAVLKILDETQGEIDRHLLTSQIRPRPEDKHDLVADYPLLPTRHRFWELVLRRLDQTGTHSQLRTQLRVVHQANKAVANRPLGTVIPGDMIFDLLQDVLTQSGVLPREVSQIVSDQQDGTDDGLLRARLVATIFLVNRLSSEHGAQSGVQATADTLADLLVDDLTVGSAGLRGRIRTLLAQLEANGTLLVTADGEYRIQTGESLRWEQAFKGHFQSANANLSLIGEIRTEQLRKLMQDNLKLLPKVQGLSKVTRSFAVQFDGDRPADDPRTITIWVRSGWLADESTVVNDAREFGTEDATIHVFVPHLHPEELRRAIATAQAAQATLNEQGSPSTDAGRIAEESMAHRRARFERERNGILQDALLQARVYQSGGHQVDGDTLMQALGTAFANSLDRKYPQFQDGDAAQWGKVFDNARNGSGDPLKAVGHQGNVLDHAVPKAIRKEVGGEPGKTWSELRAQFMAAPYGWSQDAVDGALLALFHDTQVRATRNGAMVSATRDLTPQQAGSIRFIGEGVTVSQGEYLAARSVFTKLGLVASDNEAVRQKLPQLVEHLQGMARQAGGEPPSPLPPKPAWLSELATSSGNQQIKVLAALRDTIEKANSDWTSAASMLESRRKAWHTLERLSRHAQGLPVMIEVQPQIEAIVANRGLLDEPDPVPPLRDRLSTGLRERLNDLHATAAEQFAAEESSLHASDEWVQLRPEQQQGIVTQFKLVLPTIGANLSDADLLNSLDQTPVETWDERVQGLPGRFALAHAEAARLLEPTVEEVSLTKPLMKTEADVRKWVRETQESLLAHIKAGHPVKIK